MRKIGLLMLAALLALAGGAASAQDDGGVQVIGGDADSLRALLERWALSFSTGFDGSAALYVGALPDDLPFAPIVPDGADVLGTLVVSSADGENLTAFLDTGLAPDAVLNFYREALRPTFEERAFPGGGGFVGGMGGVAVNATFCGTDDEDSFVSVTAAVFDDVTQVILSLQNEAQYSPCQSAPDASSVPYALLPRLTQPADVRVTTSSGGGGSSNSVNTTANLIGDVRADALAEHYNEQLAEAGWTLISEASVEGVATSHWTFTDDEGDAWTGVLVVTETPVGSDRRLAILQVDRERE